MDNSASSGSREPAFSAVSGVEQEAHLAQGSRTTELSREAADRGRRANPSHLSGSGSLSDLGLVLSDVFKNHKGYRVARLGLLILAVLVANMFGQVRLNEWNGAFFDAVEKRDGAAFLHQLLVFLAIVGCLLVLVVAQTWLQERLKVRLRERLTETLLDLWLRPKRAYHLGLRGEAGSQPDQRLQEDCRLFAEFSTELGVGMLQAFLLLVSFIGVLWTLSSYASFTFEGREVVIPGYMVWVAVGYAGLGSGLTWLVGKPLIRLNTVRYAREADLRFALVRVSESAESISFYAGEADERRSLDQFVSAVLHATTRLSGALARLTWITSGYGWLALVVPIIAAAPGYFSGRLSFGEMMMVVGAFNQVQAALRYFVDNFPKIADWRSALLRVATFRQAAMDLDDRIAGDQRIELSLHENGWLVLEGLSIALSNGSIVIDEASAMVRPGERVLVVGASGSGKSTLFRAVAGLWPWGSGRIETPPPDNMMFLPQRPYLPLGTLRAAVSYPKPPGTFSDAEIREALGRCTLGEFQSSLDRVERWDRMLSLGQQQRIAFARVLLHRPEWIFMDEATSALDDENQAEMLHLFETDLPESAVLSIGHRPGLDTFHHRTLQIRKAEDGAIRLSPKARRRDLAAVLAQFSRRMAGS